MPGKRARAVRGLSPERRSLFREVEERFMRRMELTKGEYLGRRGPLARLGVMLIANTHEELYVTSHVLANYFLLPELEVEDLIERAQRLLATAPTFQFARDVFAVWHDIGTRSTA